MHGIDEEFKKGTCVDLSKKDHDYYFGSYSSFYIHEDMLKDTVRTRAYQRAIENNPEDFKDKVVSADKLAVSWLETRSEKEMVIYPQICKIAHDIIKEGFSEKVIQPGVTTTDDVMWWYREKIKELKLDTWFQPTVSIQRN